MLTFSKSKDIMTFNDKTVAGGELLVDLLNWLNCLSEFLHHINILQQTNLATHFQSKIIRSYLSTNTTGFIGIIHNIMIYTIIPIYNKATLFILINQTAI